MAAQFGKGDAASAVVLPLRGNPALGHAVFVRSAVKGGETKKPRRHAVRA
jgi:hypothetical protein